MAEVAPSRKRSRKYCITINNYPAHYYENLGQKFEDHASYVILAKEVGDSGTLHLQGFIYFINARTFEATKKLLKRIFPNPLCHIEMANGTSEQAIAYCKKDGYYITWGTPPMTLKEQGEAGDAAFKEIIDKAKAADIEYIEEHHPKAYLQYYGTINKIKEANMEPPSDIDWNVQKKSTVWIQGPSGCGKSYTIRNVVGKGNFYDKLLNKWWDGFHHDIAIIDDIDPENAKYLRGHLKRWCDIYAFTVEVKGGTRSLRPNWILITSQYTIEQVFTGDQESIDAMTRRCHLMNMSVATRDFFAAGLKTLLNIN